MSAIHDGRRAASVHPVPPRRVAIFVHRFLPETGGIEVTADVLARGFQDRHGAEVLVVTRNEAPADFDADLPYRVLRAPSHRELLAAVRGADVVFHNNALMQFYWAQLLCPRPWVVTMRAVLRVPGHRISAPRELVLKVKERLIRRATVLAANSRMMAEEIGGDPVVVHNSYRDQVFFVAEPVQGRDRHRLAFVGRLSADKGIDVLLDAVARLQGEGTPVHVDLIGSGDEEPELRARAAELGVTEAVHFHGNVPGEQVNELLNRAAVMVLPSTGLETFGTVVLEAQAAGCAVAASDIGGIPEALGGTGVLVPPGDTDAWVSVLRSLILDDAAFARAHAGRQENADAHRTEAMVDRYWELVVQAHACAQRPRRCAEGRRR
ncbi:glycosyltransferase family 4 protein [Micrococcus lylae]|uniref:glycosyltransferase family 4 protein n=1 Tax=Micrococcus lylae TaxID=1273 RepID=UPI002155F257|nr:glycosyltransferase family 4 protein [Micrococcus lylae]WIK82371.1 glycosyltransferase family 4 protein [Micrococcus lylae]